MVVAEYQLATTTFNGIQFVILKLDRIYWIWLVRTNIVKNVFIYFIGTRLQPTCSILSLLCIVCIVAPLALVAGKRVACEIVVVLTILQQLLQVFIKELLPQLLIYLAKRFGIPSQVLNELNHFHAGWLCPIVAGRVALEIVVTLLIAKAPVKVPNRSEDIFALFVIEVLAIAEGTLGMIQLEITDEFINHEESCQLLQINIRRDVLLLVESCHESIKAVLNLIKRQSCRSFCELRFLNVDGQIVRCGAELLSVRLVVIRVQLQKSSSRFVFKVDAIVREAHLFRQVITAAIFAIKVKVDRHNMVGSTCFHKVCSLHADSIRHQRAADTICQQYPVPTFSHTKRLHLICEPYPIRLLCPAPAAVSSTLDLHRSLFH